MIKKIYLILCGEDEHKRPRSRKLLELIRNDILNNNEYKIVVSGLSVFNLNPESSESSRLSKYLIKNNVPKENIILEKESLDTLGNMVFSHTIIEQIIRQNPQEPIEITLITEGFHMKRSEELFLKIFNDLKNINNKLTFNFERANTGGISSFFWKRKSKVIIEKIKIQLKIRKDIKKRHLEPEKDIVDFFKKSSLVSIKYLKDFAALEIILLDIKKFRLKTYEEFENFLFSLPIYNEKYKPKHRYLIKFSLYALAINISLMKENQNKRY